MLGTLVLVIGSLGALFTLFITDAKRNQKKWFTRISIILIIIGTGFSIEKELAEEDQKEEEKIKLTENFKSTLQQGDSAIKRINIVIDSLQTVQIKTQQIMKYSDTQLQLQSRAMDTSRFLLQKSQVLLNNQFFTNQTVDRLLNPFFPVSIKVALEIPLDDSSIAAFSKYTSDSKKEIENDNSAMNGVDTNLFQPIFQGKKIIAIKGWVDSFKINSNILNSLLDTTQILFFNPAATIRKMLAYPPLAKFALYSKGKFNLRGKEYNVDFIKNKLTIEESYLNYEYGSPPFMAYGKNIGFYDLINSTIVLDRYTSSSNFKITEIRFRKEGMQEEYRVKFKPSELINMGLHGLRRLDNSGEYNRGAKELYIHRITSKDLAYWY